MIKAHGLNLDFCCFVVLRFDYSLCWSFHSLHTSLGYLHYCHLLGFDLRSTCSLKLGLLPSHFKHHSHGKSYFPKALCQDQGVVPILDLVPLQPKYVAVWLGDHCFQEITADTAWCQWDSLVVHTDLAQACFFFLFKMGSESWRDFSVVKALSSLPEDSTLIPRIHRVSHNHQ